MIAPAWGIIITPSSSDEFAPDVNTAFLMLGSKPVLTHSLAAFERCPEIEGLVLVATKERLESVRAMVQMFGCYKVKKIIAGPTQRVAAVMAGLRALEEEEVSFITVHDGTRPCVTPDQISETIKSARKHGSGVLASRIHDPVKAVAKGTKVTECLNEGSLWTSLTPQSFKTEILRKALDAAHKKKVAVQDEAEALAVIKAEIHVVPTEKASIRIASPLDLNLAEFLLRH